LGKAVKSPLFPKSKVAVPKSDILELLQRTKEYLDEKSIDKVPKNPFPRRVFPGGVYDRFRMRVF
jgi:hypothetical protein